MNDAAVVMEQGLYFDQGRLVAWYGHKDGVYVPIREMVPPGALIPLVSGVTFRLELPTEFVLSDALLLRVTAQLRRLGRCDYMFFRTKGLVQVLPSVLSPSQRGLFAMPKRNGGKKLRVEFNRLLPSTVYKAVVDLGCGLEESPLESNKFRRLETGTTIEVEPKQLEELLRVWRGFGGELIPQEKAPVGRLRHVLAAEHLFDKKAQEPETKGD